MSEMSDRYDVYNAGASIFGAAGSIYSGYIQSKALKQQGEYQRQMAGFNARLAEMQAVDAIDRGNKDANNINKRGKQMLGEQRVTLAAQGIDINSGSAQDIQNDTRESTAMDAMTTRNNAAREAWGYKVQSMNATNQGAFDQMAANNSAASTMLTGGMNATKYGIEGYGNYLKYHSEAKPSVPTVSGTSTAGSSNFDTGSIA